MPPKIKLPPHCYDSMSDKSLHSRDVGSCTAAWKNFSLPLQALHPVINIAHRLVGNVAVRYREIIDFECIAILDGHGDFHIGTERYRYGPGTLLFIPPCTPHTLISRSGPHGDHFAVHFDLSPQCPGHAKGSKKRPGNYRVSLENVASIGPVLDLDDTCLSLLAEAIWQHQSQDPLAGLRASIVIQRLFLHVIEHHLQQTATTNTDPAVADALRCIATYYAEPLCVDDIAAASGLQRSRFAERFKAWSGRPPMSFLRRYRIDRAAEMLDQQAECTLADVAAACGFADAFSLSKAFKAELGMSPASYRTHKLARR